MRRGFFRNKKAVEEPTTADIMAVVGTIVIAVSIVVVFSVNIPSSIESAEVVLEEAETGAAARMMMSTILSSYDENLDMTGAQIISRMGADRQWAQAVGLDEIDEIVPLARVGDFCLLRPSSELYEDYIVDYDIDELTFTTGALQFPPDYFERIQSSDLSWWQGICMSSNTEDPCEDFTVSMIAGGGNIPAVSGQPCEWREFDGSIDGGWSHFKFEIRFLDSAESIRWQAGNEPRQSNEVSEIIQYLPIISGNNQNVNRIKLTLHTWDSNSDRATRQNVARSGGLN